MKIKSRQVLLTVLLATTFFEVLADGCFPSIQTEVKDIGPGHQIVATEVTTPNRPDFIVTKTWLTTPWKIEMYQYSLSESIDMKAQSKNIGSGSCGGDITGHFYLSKKYKEDAHSGTDSWQRVASTNTHCSNLDPNETNTETKSIIIGNWITVPGIYNIVYCIDHPFDDHNNGGNYPEEHESNNCSTEAVFEVVASSVSPPQNSVSRAYINSLLLD